LLIVLRRSNARSACSVGFKPILSKRADCPPPADGGVHAAGGVAVDTDEDQASVGGNSDVLPDRAPSSSVGIISLGHRVEHFVA
jgi:hypothetical protein